MFTYIIYVIQKNEGFMGFIYTSESCDIISMLGKLKIFFQSFFWRSDSDQKSMIDLFRLIGRKTIDFFFNHGISIIDFRSLNFGMIE